LTFSLTNTIRELLRVVPLVAWGLETGGEKVIGILKNRAVPCKRLDERPLLV
jgi:hypothetical protein